MNLYEHMLMLVLSVHKRANFLYTVDLKWVNVSLKLLENVISVTSHS